MNTENPIIFERQKNIGFITLNRPSVLNAINRELLGQLNNILSEIANDDAIHAVVITGAGKKAFSAGADIEYLNSATPLLVRKLAESAISINNQIENLGKVSIAAINGYALGGGLELAESCTLRVASNNALMGHPEVRIGAIAGWGGTTRLPRLIGKGKATELLLTGKSIKADEALDLGLVNRLCASEHLIDEVNKLLAEILSQSHKAVNLTWEAIHRGLDKSLPESSQMGADYFGLAATTNDFREGTKAFLEKRPAKFSGE